MYQYVLFCGMWGWGKEMGKLGYDWWLETGWRGMYEDRGEDGKLRDWGEIIYRKY